MKILNKKEITKDSRLQVRVTAEKLEEYKRKAEAAGLTLAEYVSRCVECFDPQSGYAPENKEKAVELD